MTAPGYKGFNNWKAGTSRYKANDLYTVNADITFTAQWAYNSVSNIAAYLAGTAGTQSDPVTLEVTLDLADGTNGWAALLSAVAAAGDYVDLDLSGCTMSGMNGVFDPDNANSTGKDKIVSLVLPDAAASIADGANHGPMFLSFTNLKTISGANITSIGAWAFGGFSSVSCTSLSSVSFPQAASIGDSAFYGCTGLSSVSLPQAASIGTYAFYNCTGLTSVSLPQATSIGEGAFQNCSALSSVSFPQVTTIGGSAFGSCTGLSSVSFPQAASIVESAFTYCSSLSSVSLPQAASIGAYAFEYCTSLSSVSLPQAASIGAYAFRGTGTGPLTITLGATPPVVGSEMFRNVNAAKTVIVKVPFGSTENYTTAWIQAFKGVGGSASAADGGGAENTHITVNITAL
jgi:hypothetical protein